MTTMQSSKRRTRLVAVGALAIAAVAFAAISLGGLGENLVYYWGPTELHDAKDKAIGATIRLGGQVVKGSIQYDEGTSNLAFEVTDGVKQVAVRSHGVPPQMFREDIGVIVEGTMTKEGHFQSHRLMVSHGNEYKAPEPGEEIDTEALIRSAELGEGR
jgi:cytochrome c-type biogenesis protein CcmE